MKPILIAIILFISSIASFAQIAKFTIFTENGERFFAYMNGKLLNAGLQSSVTSKNLAPGGVVVRIKFDKEIYKPQNFNLLLQEGNEINIMLKLNKKGEYVSRFAGATPIVEEKEEEMVTYTTTTIETTGGTPKSTPIGKKVQDEEPVETKVTTETTYVQTTVNTNSSTNKSPKVECTSPISETMFDVAKTSIFTKSFDDTKLTEAKQIIDGNCMTSYQIMDLMTAFTYEESKLSFAKYAYNRCTDKANYFVINDAFTYDSSISNLTNYIKSQK